MDLKAKAVQSTAWYGATRFVTQIISWANTLVLARLLAPEDYGLFAMAYAVISFFELFQEFGLGAAIIQRQNLKSRQVNSVFWTLMGVSAVLALATALGAPVAAKFYREPRLVNMVRALAVTFLFSSLGTVPQSLLTKEIDFRRRSLAEALGVLAYAATSILFAHAGFRFWALVAGAVARVATRNVLMLVLARWWPALEYDLHQVRDVLHFGLNVAGATILKEVSPMVNTAILGRFLGGGQLGFYTMANVLGSNPLHQVTTGIINQLALPIFSKLQNDLQGLRYGFLRITKYLSVLSAPMQFGLALVAPDLVAVFLSRKWDPIIPIFRIFCIGGLAYVLPLPATPLLTAQGHVRKVFHYSAAYSVGMALAMLIGSQFGLNGVAIAWAIAFPLFRLSLLGQALWDVRLSPRAYWGAVGASIVSSLTMVAAVLAARVLLPRPDAAWQRLLLDVLVGAAVYSASILALDRGILGEGREILALLRGRRAPAPAPKGGAP